jgi:hypothetical protein
MDVEQKQVRLELRKLSGRFGRSAGSIDKLVSSAAQQHLQRCANHWVIVD